MSPLIRSALWLGRHRAETPPEHIARLRASTRSNVMGRDAVTVIAVCYIAPAGVQLTPGVAATASAAVDGSASTLTAFVWAAVTLVAIGTHLSSLRVAGYVDRRRAEIIALVLLSITSAIYVLSVLDAVGALDTSWALASSLALVVNCLGRAWLLWTQVRSFRWLRRRGYDRGVDG